VRPNASSPTPVNSAATAARPESSTPSRRLQPSSHLPEHGVTGDGHVAEGDSRGVAAVDHPGPFDVDAFALRVDEEQRQAAPLPGCPAGARGHDQKIGHMPVHDEGLEAVQPEAVPVGLRPQGDVRRPVLGSFVDRKRRQSFSRRDRRQVLRLLRLRAAQRQRAHPEHGGGEEGRRGQAAADLLHDHAGFDMAEAGAAVSLRHEHAGQAQLSEPAPELS
jgi:hypothetical protein